MTPEFRKRLVPVAALGALAIAAACTDERTTVLEPQAIQYGFLLAADGRNLPGGTVQYRRPRTSADVATNDTAVIVTLRGLDSLPNNVYQVWLADTTTDGASLTAVLKATGTLRVIRTDSSLNTLGDIVPNEVVTTTTGSSFKNGGPATRIELTVTRASLGLSSTAQTPLTRALVLVTIESDANATTPGALRPLWARRAERSAEIATTIPGTVPPVFRGDITAVAPVRFGNFAIRSSGEYRFQSVGRGRGAIGDRFIVLDDSSLMRPPIGYYFAGAAIKRDTANKAVDTLDMGPQSAPRPRRSVSLREADVATPDPVVQISPPSIIAAGSRVSMDTIARFQSVENPFRGFSEAYVTLENKLGRPNVIAPTIILSGTVPGIVRNGPAAP